MTRAVSSRIQVFYNAALLSTVASILTDSTVLHRKDFSFELPESLIARYPLDKRSDSRLLILDGDSGEIEHSRFESIIDSLEAGDVLVFNNTRVIPARMFGAKVSGGKVEILVERIESKTYALCMMKSSRSPKPGAIISLEDGSTCEVVERQGMFFRLRFGDDISVLQRLERSGSIPLPPYMQRVEEALDQERYQTVYNEVPGAVAAPTAGLHFTRELIEALRSKGVKTAFVTLHVGSGTFQPVKVDNIEEHSMHAERFAIDEATATVINEAKAAGKRVIAVGTTSVRVLESNVVSGKAVSGEGETDIFLYPGKTFHIVDGLITNFHLPESTLIMLVSAFAGTDNIMRAYREAVDESYRFFSYGDAMFLTRKSSGI